jgi:hypothetical protein
MCMRPFNYGSAGRGPAARKEHATVSRVRASQLPAVTSQCMVCNATLILEGEGEGEHDTPQPGEAAAAWPKAASLPPSQGEPSG